MFGNRKGSPENWFARNTRKSSTLEDDNLTVATEISEDSLSIDEVSLSDDHTTERNKTKTGALKDLVIEDVPAILESLTTMQKKLEPILGPNAFGLDVDPNAAEWTTKDYIKEYGGERKLNDVITEYVDIAEGSISYITEMLDGANNTVDKFTSTSQTKDIQDKLGIKGEDRPLKANGDRKQGRKEIARAFDETRAQTSDLKDTLGYTTKILDDTLNLSKEMNSASGLVTAGAMGMIVGGAFQSSGVAFASTAVMGIGYLTQKEEKTNQVADAPQEVVTNAADKPKERRGKRNKAQPHTNQETEKESQTQQKTTKRRGKKETKSVAVNANKVTTDVKGVLHNINTNLLTDQNLSFVSNLVGDHLKVSETSEPADIFKKSDNIYQSQTRASNSLKRLNESVADFSEALHKTTDNVKHVNSAIDTLQETFARQSPRTGFTNAVAATSATLAVSSISNGNIAAMGAAILGGAAAYLSGSSNLLGSKEQEATNRGKNGAFDPELLAEAKAATKGLKNVSSVSSSESVEAASAVGLPSATKKKSETVRNM